MSLNRTIDYSTARVGRRILVLTTLCILILFSVVLVAASAGSARIPLDQTYRILVRGLPLLGGLIDVSGLNPNFIIIIQRVRLPRILLAVFVGMALSGAGVVYQGLFRNPMADPYIIGISSGASLAVALAVVTGLSGGVLGFSGLMISAFSGALLVSLLVFSIARSKSRYVSVIHLILSGIAVGSLCAVGTSFLMIVGTEEMHRIVFWIMGSLTTAQWSQVLVVGPTIAAGCALLFLFTKDLNLMALGEQRARQLGVDTERFKNVVIVLCSLIVAAAVSVSGIIGFIGLVVPHIMRIIVGPDNRVLFPVSAVVGAITLLAADTLARTVMVPREIPVGILTAQTFPLRMLFLPIFLGWLCKALAQKYARGPTMSKIKNMFLGMIAGAVTSGMIGALVKLLFPK
jgi:iron complex transport system permease protein